MLTPGQRPLAVLVALAGGLAATPATAAAGAGVADAPLPGILVLAPTPLPGTALAVEQIPGVVQTLLAADLATEGTASLSGALEARLSSVSITDTLDDQFQPDIYYRGFAASPVLGTAQGLAVYQNGVRINEAFGDTVNWDLVPDLAIARVDTVSANPLYGLNALGGAVAITMKNGFDAPGGSAEAVGGSFNQRAAAMQYGASDGRLGLYAAARLLGQDGWRNFAHDTLQQLYADLSLRDGALAADLGLTHAEARLNGQGAAPVQELAISPQRVFTDPQAVHNRLDFVTLNLSWAASSAVSAQAAAYLRDFRQDIDNGNTTAYVGCAAPGEAGLLCQGDGTTPLQDSTGGTIPNPARSSGQPLGEVDLESIRALGDGLSVQLSDAAPLGGLGNLVTAGVALDAAHVDFGSRALPGIVNAALWVIPAGPAVATGEASGFAATPVALQTDSLYSGAYATDTVSLGERVALTASARYNVATVDLADQRGSALSGDNRFAHLDRALGATWQLRGHLTAYANYAGSSRAPTASEIECSDPRRPCLLPSTLAGDPPGLREVIASTLEFGLRGRESRGAAGATWNLALFRTGLHDDIGAIATSGSTGFYQNIGETRREGLEGGLSLQAARWRLNAQGSLITASFRSAFREYSPSNPYADAAGDIAVSRGDRLPGIPQNRLKLGVEREFGGGWSAGFSLAAVGSRYYSGDESNQNAPLPGYRVAGLHVGWHPLPALECYASIRNLFDARYATYGLFSDPEGVGAPGVTGSDRRFQSPAAPRALYAGLRLTF